MKNCVARLRACGIPDSTILLLTAFVDTETLETYLEIIEAETEKR